MTKETDYIKAWVPARTTKLDQRGKGIPGRMEVQIPEGSRNTGHPKSQRPVQVGLPPIETKQDPVGLLGTEDFLPRFLFIGNRLQIRTVDNQGREGMQKQGRSSQETIVQPGGRVLVPPQGIRLTISLSSFTELKPATNRRCQHSSFQRSSSGNHLRPD